MRITAKSNTKALAAHFEKIFEYQRSQMLKTAGREIVVDILRSTALGQDANGKKFSPYNEQYKKRRRRFGLEVDMKDLRFFGKMLASLTFYDGKSEVNVGDEFQKIAEGQMYHPKWKDESHSLFLLASERAQEKWEGAIKSDLDKINGRT